MFSSSSTPWRRPAKELLPETRVYGGLVEATVVSVLAQDPSAATSVAALDELVEVGSSLSANGLLSLSRFQPPPPPGTSAGARVYGAAAILAVPLR